MTDRIRQIAALGQSVWIDYISRDLLRSGKLDRLVEAGVTGLTSNPTIFQKAIAGGSDYDAEIRELVRAGRSTADTYESIAVHDIAEAADKLRPVYNETHGRDGFVSIEVSPTLAHDTAGTIAEAQRLYGKLHRPNVMIKVPATEAGLPAITTLIGAGINVNVTLIFSVAMYERVMAAYLEGLRQLQRSGRPLGLVSSVASFFVSRLDTLIDGLLQQRIDQGEEELEELQGRAAIANAKIAYSRYKAVFLDGQFAELRSAGARVQRPLWASTSTKNPAYSPTMYVDNLIGPNTVNTMPPQTLDALDEHGHVSQSLEQGVAEAHATMRQLETAGIDLSAVTDQLQLEGVKAFADSFAQLLADVERKRAALLAAA